MISSAGSPRMARLDSRGRRRQPSYLRAVCLFRHRYPGAGRDRDPIGWTNGSEGHIGYKIMALAQVFNSPCCQAPLRHPIDIRSIVTAAAG